MQSTLGPATEPRRSPVEGLECLLAYKSHLAMRRRHLPKRGILAMHQDQVRASHAVPMSQRGHISNEVD